MKKIPLDIVALSQSVTQSHNYAVVLGERHGNRRLPIIIGGFEAQAIAVAWERMTPNRPLTHDLFKNVMDVFQLELKEIIINNLLDGIFYAHLVCLKDKDVFEIDSRTSDALALAVRYNCPIYTYEFILEAAGIVLEETEDKKASVPKGRDSIENSLSSHSVEELQKMLEDVLTNEDYEQAAIIRDELKRRKR